MTRMLLQFCGLEGCKREMDAISLSYMVQQHKWHLQVFSLVVLNPDVLL